MIDCCEAMDDPGNLKTGLSALVAFSGRSHEHVSRSFRKVFGFSPSAYVTIRRMQYAAKQLIETNLPIIDISLSCGIDDLSHFYRAFRRQFGMPPKRYRERNQIDLVHPNG